MATESKKCPVCDWEITDGGQEVKVADAAIAVCCDDCAKKLRANPAQYVTATKE